MTVSKGSAIADLSRKATVDKTNFVKYAIKSWLSTVAKLYEQADAAYAKGSLDNAYIYYMKGCSIMVEIIKKHPQFDKAKKDTLYKELKRRTNDQILNLLEEITAQLQADDKDNGQDLLEAAIIKYPAIDDFDSKTLLDDLPSVPIHLPSDIHNPPSQPSFLPSSSSSLPTTPSSSLSPPPPPHTYDISPNDHMVLADTCNSISSSQQQQFKEKQGLNIQFPSPLKNFTLTPPTLIANPKQLASWISLRKGDAHQLQQEKPSVLILDIRPRHIFDQGFIKHKWIVQIEPLILKQNITSKQIEESMLLNPDTEQQIFAHRHHFDIIVFYDANSTTIQQCPALRQLTEAIYELEFIKTLQRAPIMLAGGFNAWKQIIGERGIYRYAHSDGKEKQQQQQSEKDNQRKNHSASPRLNTNNEPSADNPSVTAVKVHHTVYDYFSDAASTRTKESMTKSSFNGQTVPPIRGVFSNTLNQSYNGIGADATAMPVPHPSPALSTSAPYKSTLQRKKTFIDNPFHGFTTTTNKQFEVPPIPPKPTRPLPSPPTTNTTISELAATNFRQNNYYDTSTTTSPPRVLHNEYRMGPISSNAFSQQGSVMIGITGLKNLGNTCFMNSIIQCLSGTIPFARYYISGVYRQHINKDNFLGTGGELAESFASLLRTMWSENYNFISPVLFRQALIKFAPQFQGSEQHDSQEFLNFLLDGLHEDCNLVVKGRKGYSPSVSLETAEDEAQFEKLPDWQASAIAWEKYLQRNSSVVVSLFQGQYRSRLTCLTCHTTSTTYNAFMSLSLPIPATRHGPSSVSIYDCLDYFVKEEILDQDDAWNCPRCKTRRRASKALTLSKLPDVLLIHLKRFSFDGPFKDKLETYVNSAMVGLDLSRYVPEWMFPPSQTPDPSSFKYDLYAVSNHYGSLTGGHYTACVRNAYKNEWHNFDDTRFSICDPSKVLSKAAYNLFYVRSTVK
ncbi:hypothetical protein BDF20DRAFT_914642 [Mycotypha africana]|uniref:uncharacterized protein n=1 Tax=Mycotypha africana TaxID=64632 RepID=UPI002300F106|nr:uncharacterized protein BDF20DRAFT_914642 [Mycotypha africana]KAI8975785.1 hypothetical protein BDF20DRAFT_914642 [Mycotypha africana]